METTDRELLHRLAALMGWPQWDFVAGDAAFPAGTTYWADTGYRCGVLVYRPDGEQSGACWNPLVTPADAVELAEYLSRDDSPYTLEVARTYKERWRVGSPGWAALFVPRFSHMDGDQVEERCLTYGVWAPTFARAVSLAALHVVVGL